MHRSERLSHVQAIMVGPLLMAGLTEGSRRLVADPDTVASLLSDVSSESLVEIGIGGDASSRLRHAGRAVHAAGSATPRSLYDSWHLRRIPER